MPRRPNTHRIEIPQTLWALADTAALDAQVPTTVLITIKLAEALAPGKYRTGELGVREYPRRAKVATKKDEIR